jgi:hypothetical protein
VAKTESRLTTVLVVVSLVFACDKAAYAYIDPGTGSFVLQVLFGGVAGAVVLFKMYWKSLREKFGLPQKPAEGGLDSRDR